MSSASPNYIQDNTGNTYIPPSQRPDGTWRRPIRVKDGYVPQDEQPLYVSRGRQSTDKSPYPVGLSPEDFKNDSRSQTQSTKIPSSLYFEIGKYEPVTKIPGLNFVQDSAPNPSEEKKSTNSKKKKKSKGSKSNENEIKISEPFTPATKKNSMTHVPPTLPVAAAPTKTKPQQNVQSSGANNTNNQTQAQGSDPVKRLRNLKKKLKDIESLEQKVKSGELKSPDKDQLDKIQRKDEVLDQIDELQAIVESLNLS